MTTRQFNVAAYALISLALLGLAASWQWLGGIELSGVPALHPVIALPLALVAAGVSFCNRK